MGGIVFSRDPLPDTNINRSLDISSLKASMTNRSFISCSLRVRICRSLSSIDRGNEEKRFTGEEDDEEEGEDEDDDEDEDDAKGVVANRTGLGLGLGLGLRLDSGGTIGFEGGVEGFDGDRLEMEKCESKLTRAADVAVFADEIVEL